MDLSTITVQDFKDLFPRDFAYLPTWVSGTYNTDDEVYYAVNGLFYRCINDGVTTVPTNVTDWVQYSDKTLNYVLDSDIEKAFSEAQITFNQSLFTSDANIQIGYLYLTAHYLVNDLKAASQGVSSQGSGVISSKSVGSVSTSYAIPEAWTKDPVLNFYTTSAYGLKYLNMVLPAMVGNVNIVAGATNP